MVSVEDELMGRGGMLVVLTLGILEEPYTGSHEVTSIVDVIDVETVLAESQPRSLFVKPRCRGTA